MRVGRRRNHIICVEPNYYGEFLSEPNDPSFDQQWYLPNIDTPAAWDKSLGNGVIVGLVDSGVDINHEELADNILTDGWDFGDNDDDPSDESGHGTTLCGVIAAIQNNNLGFSGTAPGCKILPLKVSEGKSDIPVASAVASAVIYASDYGAKIVNLSLKFGIDSQMVKDAIEYAASKDVLLVAAAGNEHGPVLFPANQDEVIAVSATDENDKKIYQSAFGPELDLVAPGRFILTTSLGGLYTYASGTSYSSAIVSAVVALLVAKYPHLTRDQIREYLIMRVDDLGDEGKDNVFGYGKVNALRTLDPIITFMFPSIIIGSKNMPLVYLLAIFGEDTYFMPFISKVSFESAHLTSLGHPLVFLPNFLLQTVILESTPEEGYSDIIVTTGTKEVSGCNVLSIGLLPWNF